MMPVPQLYAKYIGLAYLDKGRTRAGVDCWGLARLALHEQTGVSLPDYCDAYSEAGDMHSVSRAVRAGLAHGWQRVERPRELDLLIIHIAGRPWHCGLMVGSTMFLHVPPPNKAGVQQLSCIERLDSPYWSGRQKEFWRCMVGVHKEPEIAR